MPYYASIRRSLAICLALCLLGQAAWLGFRPAAKHPAAHLSRHLLVPAQRVALSSGKGPSAAPTIHWLPRIAAACSDFRPQSTVSLLPACESADFARLPGAASRFGRAPPSHIA